VYGEIFTDDFIANLLMIIAVKQDAVGDVSAVAAIWRTRRNIRVVSDSAHYVKT